MGVGDDFGWHCQGQLLNISAAGMAVRIVLGTERGLCVDQFLDARFSLYGTAGPFDLRARIANLTPAGTPQHRIVGLEFVDSDRYQDGRKRLEHALHTDEFSEL